MEERAIGIDCGVSNRVKHYMLRWFGGVRKWEKQFIKRVYMSSVEIMGMRGRLLVK